MRRTTILSKLRRCAMIALTAGALASVANVTFADDWRQYRGSSHDGSTPEQINSDWAAKPPKELWRIPAGEGFGSFAAVGDKVFVLMAREKNEVCVALSAADGKELWATTIDSTIFEKSGGNGPRTTPAVIGDKVYVFGTNLKLQALNIADGKVVWQHNIKAEFDGGKVPKAIQSWGGATSPVVVGDHVIVAGGGAGQSFLAFNKETGALVWKTGTGKFTHASPTPGTIGGVEQVVFFMEEGLSSRDPISGKELWNFPFKFSTSTASSPLICGDIAFCSAGYGVGSGAAKIEKKGDGFSATELYHIKDPFHWTTPVYLDGHIYGIVGFKQFGSAPLKCIDVATGKVKWEKEGFGSGGATILAGGKLIVQHDNGSITLVDPNPDAYKELGKITPLAGKCWTMPVVANGKMFCRSTKEIVALDVAK